MSELIFREECYRIIGACMEVHKLKGSGFLEGVYQECTELEFSLRGIPFVARKPLLMEYKGHPLRSRYEPDFLCFDRIILELKATGSLVDEHRAQLLNYLSATGFTLGLLVNFGRHQKLEWERFARTSPR